MIWLFQEKATHAKTSSTISDDSDSASEVQGGTVDIRDDPLEENLCEKVKTSSTISTAQDTSSQRSDDSDSASLTHDGTVDIMDEPQGENLFEKVSEQTV